MIVLIVKAPIFYVTGMVRCAVVSEGNIEIGHGLQTFLQQPSLFKKSESEHQARRLHFQHANEDLQFAVGNLWDQVSHNTGVFQQRVVVRIYHVFHSICGLEKCFMSGLGLFVVPNITGI